MVTIHFDCMEKSSLDFLLSIYFCSIEEEKSQALNDNDKMMTKLSFLGEPPLYFIQNESLLLNISI